MEDAKKRWSVTYTKHIHNKRKVYQDGFLDLHTSTNKLKLYDDCEKLLECRILRRDETVSAGETLTSTSYLVDIGDPEGDQGPPLNVPKTNNNLKSSELRNVSAQKFKSRHINLTPSQKIMREFKNTELPKHGDTQSTPDRTGPSTTEWQVLYTTQLTQKAKKYHDGFLQLSLTGSLGRKVTLFDESRRVLTSRFLEKFEEVKSGESIALDGHLVETEECVANLGQGKNSNNSEVGPGQRKFHESDRTVRKGRPQIRFTLKEDVQPKSIISTINATESLKSVSTKKTFRDAHQILSILQKPLAQETFNISKCSDDERMRQASFTKKLQNVPEDCRFQKVSTLFHGSRELGVEKSPELISPEVMSYCNGEQLSEDTDTGNAHQSHSRNTQSNEAFSFDTSRSIFNPYPEPVEDKRSNNEELKVARQSDECPSFDLDFD